MTMHRITDEDAARQREAETLARIDAQFARTAGRFRDQQAATFAAEFAAWWLIGCSVFTVGTIGAALWG